MRISHQIEERLVDLAWSQWTEIGVAGTRRQHQDVAIMPEELILLTAALAPIDPRLRDESIDWCCRYHDYVSTARLRGLFSGAERALQEVFSPYAATVNELALTRWPTIAGEQPWTVKVICGL